MTSGYLADVKAQLEASTVEGYLAVSLHPAKVQWLLDSLAMAERLVTMMQAHIERTEGCESCIKLAGTFLDRLVL